MSDEIVMTAPERENGPPEDFRYYDLRSDQPKNELGSNLTELNASQSYFERGYASHRDWLAHITRFLAVARKSGTRGQRSILDVGCGKLGLPYALHQARRQPNLYWGLDLRLSEKWGELIGWKVPTRLVRCDLILDNPSECMDWPHEGFDITTCFEVLEHVPVAHQQTLIDRLFSWTTPGGLCMFSTPNYGTSASVAKNHIGDDGEIRERTYEDKLAMVAQAGFVVEGSYGTFIRMVQLPEDALKNDVASAAREFLNMEWVSVMMAAAYPSLSNNALMMLRRPK
jgi:2-polyprenyl-3-methyl-5-hydroxy-6-metoxy-1,4-benzoquinol methylase